MIISKNFNIQLSLNNYFSYFIPALLSIYFNYSIKYSSFYTKLLSYTLVKNKNKNLPNKFIILINHDFKESDLFTLYYLLNNIIPEYSIQNIVGTNFANLINIIKYIGMNLPYYYCISKTNNLYVDMYNFINKHNKCCIIIFPEGRITRYSIPKNLNPNITKCNNFEIIENNCFEYKKGAFIMSLLFNIPIVQIILYNSCPDFNYNYFNKNYKIKHINHRGAIIYKPEYTKKIIIPKNITVESVNEFISINTNIIEKERLKFQKKFIKKYIIVIKKAYKYNKYFI